METPGPRRLHPISVVGNSLKSLPGAVIGMIGVFGALVQRDPMLAVLLALVPIVLALVAALVGWWRFTYEVRGREIVIDRGLFSRQRREIPFDRVRDVAIEQPLLARIVGTAKVRIETGGAAADEGLLDMIRLEEAQRLRDHVRRSNLLSGPAAAATPAEAAEEPEEPVIFAMSVGRVLSSGLFNFSLIFVALAFGALQYLEDLGIMDFERIADAGRAQNLLGMFTLRTALLLLVLLVLLGVVSGIVRTMLRDYGFRLTASQAGLRRRRGLVTLSEVLIPARRTEAARVDTGWLSGWLGWHGLAFQTLGADAKEGGVQVAAPFAREEEIALILAQAGFPPLPRAPMVRPPARALLRRSLPWLLLAGAMVPVVQAWPYLAWGLPLPILFALLAAIGWLRDGHLYGERALFVRSGLFSRRLWVLPYEKLQTMTTRRSPLQRLLGLATIAPDTAGASPFGAPRVADVPAAEAEPLAARLLAAFYAARTTVRAAAPGRRPPRALSPN
jgi:putative membrane protein